LCPATFSLRKRCSAPPPGLAYLRRDDEAYIPQPEWVKGVIACASYGNADEVRVGAKRLLRIAKYWSSRAG
jgi:glycolate oxidase